jgi:hypothetical protein
MFVVVFAVTSGAHGVGLGAGVSVEMLVGVTVVVALALPASSVVFAIVVSSTTVLIAPTSGALAPPTAGVSLVTIKLQEDKSKKMMVRNLQFFACISYLLIKK